jgi:hypothetical protein
MPHFESLCSELWSEHVQRSYVEITPRGWLVLVTFITPAEQPRWSGPQRIPAVIEQGNSGCQS